MIIVSFAAVVVTFIMGDFLAPAGLDFGGLYNARASPLELVATETAGSAEGSIGQQDGRGVKAPGQAQYLAT